MTEAYSHLPEGWASATMGDVADVVGGGTPKSTDPDNFADDGHPWITPADLSDFDGVWIKKGRRGLSDQGLAGCSARLVPRETVLMSSRAPIGYVAIAANELCTNQGFKSFVLVKGLAPQFVFYWLRFSRAEIEQMGSGSTFMEVSGARCRQIPIIFPPLAEQKRIVAKVEALLARVNAARTRLAKAPAILKRFRQSVLAADCSGQLTADWRDRTAAPWTESSLGELIQEGPQNGLYKPRDTYGRGTFIVRIANFYDGVIQAWNQLERLEISKQELAAYCLRNGDILVNRVNSMQFLGKSALVVDLQEPCVFESNMMRFRVDVRRILPEYLIRYLNSLGGLVELRRNAKHAVNQSSINQQDVARVSVPLPSIEEQQEIVRHIEALFALADKIEARVQAAKARVEKITQAILAKAFRGELVPTEAELARAEGRTYEPATALLARIRAARATEEGSKSKKRTRPTKRKTQT